MRATTVRLMMALKLTFSAAASGVRPRTVEKLEAMLKRDVVPIIPSQGSAGASGDLAPLAHLTAAMLGVGEVQLAGKRMPGRSRARARWPRADSAWSEGRTCPARMAPSSPPPRRW